eukprot:5436407-Pleurochrysis_carterae.AAC.1
MARPSSPADLKRSFTRPTTSATPMASRPPLSDSTSTAHSARSTSPTPATPPTAPTHSTRPTHRPHAATALLLHVLQQLIARRAPAHGRQRAKRLAIESVAIKAVSIERATLSTPSQRSARASSCSLRNKRPKFVLYVRFVPKRQTKNERRTGAA